MTNSQLPPDGLDAVAARSPASKEPQPAAPRRLSLHSLFSRISPSSFALSPGDFALLSLFTGAAALFFGLRSLVSRRRR